MTARKPRRGVAAGSEREKAFPWKPTPENRVSVRLEANEKARLTSKSDHEQQKE